MQASRQAVETANYQYTKYGDCHANFNPGDAAHPEKPGHGIFRLRFLSCLREAGSNRKVDPMSSDSEPLLTRDEDNRLPRVLLVDDQVSNIQYLSIILGDSYLVQSATNGPDALKLALSVPRPDLILLDIVMPDMDGYEVCYQLKNNPSTQNIPVIFITALNSEIDEERGLNMGAVDYLSKPLSPPIVRARVHNHAMLKRRTDLLESLAHIDSLTNVANRRRFDHALDLEWRRCRRAGLPVALLMTDVDSFKAYNDHYGHGRGDVCLTKVAATLNACFHRPADLVARYGGEEFAVLLPETNIHNAVLLAERLRHQVEALRLPHAPGASREVITISIGCSAFLPGETLDARDLVESADKHLYEAKATGRNRVCSDLGSVQVGEAC